MLKIPRRRCSLAVMIVLICSHLSWAASEDVWEDDSPKPADKGAPSSREVELGGQIQTRFAHDLKEEDGFEHDGYGHGKLRVEGKVKPSDRFQAVLSVDGDYFAYYNDDDWDEDGTIRLHDAYINIRSPEFNLKAGNQIVRWGKGDGYSPLDNLNPEDYRNGIAGKREERKLPIPMVNIEWYQRIFTLQGIFIPFFVEPELDLTGTDWAYFRHADREVGGFPFKEKDPADDFSNGEFGVRISGKVRNVDFAISWFHGREDLPIPESLAIPPGLVLPPGNFTQTDLAYFAKLTGQTIFLSHNRQNIYGLEIETTWRSLGLRADLAYFDNSSFFTDDLRMLQKPVWQYILGADYSGSGGLYVNVQFFQTIVENYDDLISWGEEITNAFTANLVKEFFNANVETELQVYVDVSGDGLMLNPEVRFKYWEPVILGIGAEFFDDSTKTPFGLFEDNDQVYGLVRMAF